MSIKKEIDRAVKLTAALNGNTTPKTPAEQDQIVLTVEEAVRNSAFNFNNATSAVLSQDGKKRLVKRYTDLYSPEHILCQCIKQILDRTFKVRYPNRNKISHDLKDYFNSISSIYVFEKYLRSNLTDRHEIDLIKAFVYSTKRSYAGLCTSNALAEIIATHFDKAIRKKFSSNGVIYYERYIDDCVLVLNEHMEESETKDLLNAVLLEVFHDTSLKCLQCKTEFNWKKFGYISRRKVLSQKCSIDFLGYEFWFSSKQIRKGAEITIQYGITLAKQNKYRNRLDSFISSYTNLSSPDYGKIELLRHRIAAFSSREVYLTKHFRTSVWRVKGFISNYGELRYLLDTGLIEANTEAFLKDAIDDAFKKAGINKPYFLMGGGKINCGYNLYGNMKSNKTILLVDHIGYDYNALVNLCKQIGINNIDASGRRRGYGTLVRDYLIKVRVGY